MAKKIKFVDIKRDLHISDSCTGEIVKKFKELIDTGEIDVKKVVLCTIKYELNHNNIEKGPVRIYFLDGTLIRLNLTAGYGGTGPNDTCKLLKLCGFNFDEKDILTHQEVVDIKYCKNIEDTVYQFKNLDGSYEYCGL